MPAADMETLVYSPFAALSVAAMWAYTTGVFSPQSERVSAAAVNPTRAMVAIPFFLLLVYLEAPAGASMIRQFDTPRTAS
jgi:hypothetical protein